MISRISACLGLVLLTATTHSAELPNDKVGDVETLPSVYPDHWVYLQDIAWNHMLNGRLIVLDAEKDTLPEQYKGMVETSLVAAVAIARSKPEFYVYETFYTRGTRGERVDVVTIYDKSTLSPIDEVVIPGNKRNAITLSDFLIRLIDDERMLLLLNFNPAPSVTVIDIVNRKILNEINLPGCYMIYPSGKRGFSSLCGDGSMVSLQLDSAGQVVSQGKVDSFFDIDDDPLFERPALVDGVGYFPTFKGKVVEIDLTGEVAQPGTQWDLVDAKDRAANWRPGGMQLSGTDVDGEAYFLFHEGGEAGSHKNPGSEIWVYDVRKKKRLRRIPLVTPGFTIELSNDSVPWLFVVNIDMNMDVYVARSGEHLRTLSGFSQETPLILFSTN